MRGYGRNAFLEQPSYWCLLNTWYFLMMMKKKNITPMAKAQLNLTDPNIINDMDLNKAKQSHLYKQSVSRIQI